MSLKPYPDYKPSGVKWLGEVPAHWNMAPLGQHFMLRNETVSDKDFAPLSVTMSGVVPQMENVAKTDNGDSRKLVRCGDFVINSRSDRKGSSGIADRDGSVSMISIVLVPHGVTPRFAHHLLRSVPFQEEFYRFGTGIVADLWSTRFSAMKSIRLALPSMSEQVAISDYLDRELVDIDAFISDQEELIALLRERRTALRESIISAATHSGHSIGLKRVADITVGIVVTPAAWYATAGVPALRGLNVKEGLIEQKDLIQISEDGHRLHQKSKLKHGDVVVVRTGQAGTAAFVPAGMDGWNAIDLLIARPKRELSGNYLEILLNSETVQGQIKAGSVGAIQGHFNVGALKNLFLPVPSLETQHDIVARWNDERGLIDAAIADAHQAIKLSKERRAAVISAAVTGKIDVRDFMVPRSTTKTGAESVGVA